MVHRKPASSVKCGNTWLNLAVLLDASYGQENYLFVVHGICLEITCAWISRINHRKWTNEPLSFDWLLHSFRIIDWKRACCLWDSCCASVKGRRGKGSYCWRIVRIPFSQRTYTKCSWMDWIEQDYSWRCFFIWIIGETQVPNPKIIVLVLKLWVRNKNWDVRNGDWWW